MIEDDLRAIVAISDSLAAASREMAPLAMRLRETLGRLEDDLRPIADSQPVRVNDIIRMTAALFDVAVREMLGPGHQPHLVRARDAITYTAKKVTDYSYPRLGAVLGGRDHTTIIASRKRAAKRRATDEDFKRLTDQMVAVFDARAKGKEEPCLL